MGEHEAFRWLQLVPKLGEMPNHLVMAVLVAIMLVALGSVATLSLKAAGDATIPEGKLTFRNLFEIIAEQLYGLCENVMGEHAAEEYFPVVGTLFMFIFLNNFMGLILVFVPATENTNVTFAAGLFVFLYYNFH